MSLYRQDVKKNHLHDLKTVWHNAYKSVLFPSSILQLTSTHSEKGLAEAPRHQRKGWKSLSYLLITHFIFTQQFSLELYTNLYAFVYFEKNIWTAWIWKRLNLKSRYEAINFKASLHYFKAFLTLWITS